MRKVIQIIIAVFLLLGLTSCATKDENKEQGELIVITTRDVLNKIDNDESFAFILTQTICGHCKEYEPIVLEVCLEEGAIIYQVIADKDNADDVNELIERYSLESTPTTFVVKKGEIEDSFIGKISRSELVKYFKKHKIIK